jgi:choline-glycine betaine transporter
MNDVNNQARYHIMPGKLRIVTVAIIAVLAVGYTAAVLSGVIAPVRQLSAADLILLVLAGGLILVILRP